MLCFHSKNVRSRCTPVGVTMSWQLPHTADERGSAPSCNAECAEACAVFGNGSRMPPRITASSECTSGLLASPSTADTLWQSMQPMPRRRSGRSLRFRPSVVSPSRVARGAWHCTQKVPSSPSVSRWPRAFIATKTGSTPE